jgi:thiazole synthase/sulfur carrier protein
MNSITERLRLRVNGEAMDIEAGQTLAGLITQLGLDTRKVAVERNREIVPRSTYGAVVLTARDEIEIVHFIGGG